LKNPSAATRGGVPNPSGQVPAPLCPGRAGGHLPRARIAVDSVVERAERLRVILAACGQEPALNPAEAVRRGLPLLSARDIDLLDRVTPADLDLANACVAIEIETRAAEYERLESLLARLPGVADQSLSDRLRAIPDRAGFLDAAQLVAELAWIHPPKE
jgi:hypothetical protein